MMRVVETACRAYCGVYGVDADGRGCGVGSLMPKGSQYLLWQAQEKAITAALIAIGVDTGKLI